MQKKAIYYLALNAIVGALYFVLVFVFNFLSFDVIQFRIAEVLLILVFFNPKLAFGLIIGTFIANFTFSPFGLLDALVGTLASMVAISLMILLRKLPFFSLIFPAIANGAIVGYMIYYTTLNTSDTVSLFGAFIWVFLGEFVVMYLLGVPFYLFIKKRDDMLQLIL